MKKNILFLMACLLALPAFAQETSVEQAAAQTAEQAVAQAEQEDPAERNKMLYSLGFLLGDNLKRQLILDNEDDYKAVSQGMRDSLLNKESQTKLDEYKPQIIAKYQKDAEIISQRRLQEQKEYLENFSKEKGVKVLDNGAMIKLSKKGKGRTAKADSKVRVHYTGKLIDGTKFDSSYDREEPFTTRLTDVVPCWTKALQQMRPASKAVVVCPAETAYGNRPVGIIPAGSALIFDVELLSIED
ncbi:MAG: FKBP-type peptidyl-prolyl cis-trans isomerase [Elusimicrobiaceae bacterium]|nr:FKBP-type peptidyl-prolyl cis-trans isomerase [Elusimicrobiaceae bacterium]